MVRTWVEGAARRVTVLGATLLAVARGWAARVTAGEDAATAFQAAT